jgi:DNA-binding GntR family transcriptional regulator
VAEAPGLRERPHCNADAVMTGDVEAAGRRMARHLESVMTLFPQDARRSRRTTVG